MISRMRVQSQAQTVACAEKVMRATIDTHVAPGKAIGELRELVQGGSGSDLLKDFSEVAREELRAFTTLLSGRTFHAPQSAQPIVILEQTLARLCAPGD
jgi:hypothetical protein